MMQKPLLPGVDPVGRDLLNEEREKWKEEPSGAAHGQRRDRRIDDAERCVAPPRIVSVHLPAENETGESSYVLE